MTVSPSGKDAYLFHPENGDAKTKCKSAVDVVGKTQRELNYSSSSSSNTSFWFTKSLFELKNKQVHKTHVQTLHSGTNCLCVFLLFEVEKKYQ